MHVAPPAQPPDGFLYWFNARCVEVIDGDTIAIRTDLGFRIGFDQRVRLYGINAYELNSPDQALRNLAFQGKDYVAGKVLGRDIVINTFKDKQEKFGRYLASVYYKDASLAWHNLNLELVAVGLAVFASY